MQSVVPGYGCCRGTQEAEWFQEALKSATIIILKFIRGIALTRSELEGLKFPAATYVVSGFNGQSFTYILNLV
jgi:hypothetical protein